MIKFHLILKGLKKDFQDLVSNVLYSYSTINYFSVNHMPTGLPPASWDS